MSVNKSAAKGGGLFSTSERGIFRRTLPNEQTGEEKMLRSLSLVNLTMIGVGAIIGAGIFTLAGVVAKGTAGPAVVISFVLAGLASLAAAFAYAEFASMVPRAGSSYTYGAATLGEVVGWAIGWDLLLEYTAIVAAVAISVSGYVGYFLNAMGLSLPTWALGAPGSGEGHVLDVGAIIVCLLVAFMLSRGTKTSARFETVLTMIKIAIVLVVIIVGVFFVDLGNLSPFAPFGVAGIMSGAAVVFFAVFGYDALSTAAEESKNARKMLPKAMMWSLGISMVLYVGVSLVLAGMVPYAEIDEQSGISSAFEVHGMGWLANVIALGAIVGIVTVCFSFMMAGARLWYSLSRDGLMPKWFGAIHHKSRIPHRPTWLIGILAAVLGGLLPIQYVAELINIGVLSAFVVISISVIVLRYRKPNLKRGFKVPGMPVVPALGVLFSLYLISLLPSETFLRFFGWMVLGMIVYAVYGYRNTRKVMPGGSINIEDVNKMTDN
ncbi:amino acid permease [Saxibacter everestensis]|uniref:Amino acid permease n=1 Tax=Saxibacter everestensis TaxID=2909229 RepID=A0ABY8QVL9_9MICO|nr:amino acid permease [Brevibacteriaceae bacterium ZFBP1038]